MSQRRDLTIDILRGLAILIMIGANMGGSVLDETQVPIWFRIYSSYAAPLFILIAGMMVGLTSQRRSRGLKYFLTRGVMIMAVGALIDVLVWRNLPFTTVDVLYLIGLSLPLAYIFSRLSSPFRWIAILVVFGLTPILQASSARQIIRPSSSYQASRQSYL